MVVAVAALLTVGLYGQRINDLRWSTHRATCVAAQLAGAFTSCAVMGMSALTSPLELVICGALLALCWYHLLSTAAAWRYGPPVSETRR